MKIIMRSRRIDAGHVYVISASNGYVKIGSTGGNPFDRFSMTQCHSPLPLELDYIVRCQDPVGIEEMAHQHLAHCRVRREWFDVPAHLAIDIIRQEIENRGYTIAAERDRENRPQGPAITIRAKLTEAAA